MNTILDTAHPLELKYFSETGLASIIRCKEVSPYSAGIVTKIILLYKIKNKNSRDTQTKFYKVMVATVLT
jgi:hypothetical protein